MYKVWTEGFFWVQFWLHSSFAGQSLWSYGAQVFDESGNNLEIKGLAEHQVNQVLIKINSILAKMRAQAKQLDQFNSGKHTNTEPVRGHFIRLSSNEYGISIFKYRL